MKPMREKQVAGKVVAMKPIPRRHVGMGRKQGGWGPGRGTHNWYQSIIPGQIVTMTKAAEERLETVELEMKRLPMIEENIALLAKNIAEMNSQIDKQAQQQQVILKYIEGIIKDDTPGRKIEEGSTNKVTMAEASSPATVEEPKLEAKTEEERTLHRSKFKKVEMPVFDGTDPDSWLFRADRYFKIHNLSDSEKLTVAVISFNGPALDCKVPRDQGRNVGGPILNDQTGDHRRGIPEPFRQATSTGGFLAHGGVRGNIYEWAKPVVEVGSGNPGAQWAGLNDEVGIKDRKQGAGPKGMWAD
ncbi:transposon Tf2-1 polyprotein isoform X1 [Cucumis melo var. makuwa]|uniref:Transposon Tf2-1 polyprotein isoform X1 n=1 Tax=Cucumis melo var. makuwa TaxID=1194695 RepID=A0A5A7UWL5_CUCMM|nr:transposon Tf2-1 polyprotein isoform X1 [Cucumis melo var. makuwa]TYK14807.1 transposon Tf2-1 polyprotein isoform X1 [Cucumis melo var. makuwa]